MYGVTQLFTNNTDLVAFACGSIFLALAALARVSRSVRPPVLPVTCLAVFAALHGLRDWAGVVIRSLDDERLLALDAILLAASFLALLEFARRTFVMTGPKWLQRRWLYLALIAAALAWGLHSGTQYLHDTARLCLGIPAAGLSALALIRLAYNQDRQIRRNALRTAAFAFFIFGVTIGTLALSSGGAREELIQPYTHLPPAEIRALLLHALIALVLASCLGTLLSSALTENRARITKRTAFFPAGAPLLALLLTLLTTWGATALITRAVHRSIRHSLQERAFGITSMLDPATIEAIDSPDEAEQIQAVLSLSRILNQAQLASQPIYDLFLFAQRDGELVPIAESHTEDDEDAENWELLINELDRFFEKATSAPYARVDLRPDHIFTTIVSAHTPAPGAPVTLALAMNVSARPHEAALARWRLISLTAGALLVLFILDFSDRHYRLWISAHQIADAERRQRELSLTLEERVASRTRELSDTNAALKREMAKLQEAEIKYRTLADHVPVVTYRVDLGEKSATSFISPQIRDMLGFTAEEWMADPQLWLHVIPPDDRERVRKIVAEHDRTGEPASIEFQMLDREGRPHWVRCNQRYQRDDSGTPILAHGVMMDITETVQTVQRLRESGERYRLIFEYSPAGLFHYDHALRITDLNKRFASLMGKPRSELVGADLAAITTEEVHATLASALRGGEGYFEGARGFLPLSTDSWISLLVAPLSRDGTPDAGGLAIVQDLSEQRRIEEERMRTQKLESLGLLAGGIAHDFNNILTAILGNISLARQMALTGSDFQESLHDAERAAFRAQELTRQLLTFAKGGAPVKQLHDIVAVIREAASFTVRGSASRCVYAFAPDTWKAEIDAGQITQILQNLIINADQAMPHGGSITLATHNRMLVENEVPNLPPGPYVEVRVSDTGTGIPDRLLGRIFDPYFTTKTHGTGLGLTMCFSIIQKHGGHIMAESSEGRGTTFIFYLPAAIGEPAPSQATAPRPIESLHGTARILVMDDERAILELCRRTLQKAGYTVLTANRGEEAIHIYDEEIAAGRTIDLAILDMTVPGGMGGRDAFSALRQRNPKFRALVSSGYTQDDDLAEFGKVGFVGAVPKPYRAEDLLAAIARALQANPA